MNTITIKNRIIGFLKLIAFILIWGLAGYFDTCDLEGAITATPITIGDSAGNYPIFFATSTGTSMQPTLPEHGIVLAQKCPFDSIKKGDVIIFRSLKLGGMIVMHRVVGHALLDRDALITKGDNPELNKAYDPGFVTASNFLGKALFVTPTQPNP